MGKRLTYPRGVLNRRGAGVVPLPLEGLDKLAKPLHVEQVAKICHEANRAYCDTIGDYTQEAWEFCPEWQRQSAIKGVLFNLQNELIQPEESHKSWITEKLATGWVYGEVKDPEKKTHPCLVPYNKLPLEQQIKDHIFCCIVNACRPFVKIKL